MLGRSFILSYGNDNSHSTADRLNTGRWIKAPCDIVQKERYIDYILKIHYFLLLGIVNKESEDNCEQGGLKNYKSHYRGVLVMYQGGALLILQWKCEVL